MSAATVQKIVDDAYAALFNEGDLDTFLAPFDDNSELREVESLPYGGTFRGKDKIKAAIQSVFGYWEDFKLDIETTVYSDEYAIGYGTFSATAKKTGKRVSFSLAEVWKFKDGKVVFIQPIYGDTKAVVDALE